MQWRFLSESDSVALIDARQLMSAASNMKAGIDEIASADLVDGTVEDAQMLETAQHVGAYLDSDSEDSDSDLSGAEIDSDIEKEKQISYDRTLYREDYKVKLDGFRCLHPCSFPETERNGEGKVTAGREAKQAA